MTLHEAEAFAGASQEAGFTLSSLDSCACAALVQLVIEMPQGTLRSPAPVAKTCPETVALTGQVTTVCCIAQRAAAARVDTPILP